MHGGRLSARPLDPTLPNAHGRRFQYALESAHRAWPRSPSCFAAAERQSCHLQLDPSCACFFVRNRRVTPPFFGADRLIVNKCTRSIALFGICLHTPRLCLRESSVAPPPSPALSARRQTQAANKKMCPALKTSFGAAPAVFVGRQLGKKLHQPHWLSGPQGPLFLLMGYCLAHTLKTH